MSARKFDAIEMEVFNNRLLSITDEMGATLVRSSFSTNIKERKDCSVGIFDKTGRLVAQAMHIPLHLGSLYGGVEAVLREYRPDEIEGGDAFVCNDPYLAGGTHLPDISVVTPMFWQGELAFFLANIGHHTDVGGTIPGSSSHLARSIFEEGIRIPICKIARRGEIDRHLVGLIANNSRDPRERTLDLGVQVATNDRGVKLLERLLERSGLDHVSRAIDDCIAYAEARLRNRIAALPAGTYKGVAFMDNDGPDGPQVPIRVAIAASGNTLTLDFSESGPTARGNLNVPESALRATCVYAVKSMLDPNLPSNEGVFAPINIVTAPDTVTNPRQPAPVSGRSATCQKIARALFLAFAEFLPEEQLIAPSTDMNAAMTLSGPRSQDGDSRFVYLETIGGGAGATLRGDGMHAVQVHITNTTNLPAEAMEIEYPLLVREYGIVEGSCGPGRTRGGAGIAREIEATVDGVSFAVRVDGAVTPAPGLLGGGSGGPARVVINYRQADERQVAAKMPTTALPRGTSVRLETPGGGGFGKPGERAPKALARDLRDGLLDRDEARRLYGAALMERAAGERDTVARE